LSVRAIVTKRCLFEGENTMRKLRVLLCLFCALSALAADSHRTGRRLRVENYPELPSGVAAVLQSRRCTIPQPNRNGPARNVIQGEFFRAGQKGWAVLCSSGAKSSILVFRNNYDGSPDEIAGSPDSRFLIDTWQGETVYSREISTVNQRLILGHYRAYGGPKPPPIDHNGIDDAFLEKASITWYWREGKWVQLQGAD
jgi:hypothetical protein